MGAYDEVDDALRAQLIGQIDDALDGRLVETGFWAFLWLADIDKLEIYTKFFLGMPESSRYDLCASPNWTRALKIWTTRERVKDENRKRKSTTATPNPPTPSKVSRLAESVGRAIQDIGSPVPLSRRGRSPPSKSRSKSPSKIPTRVTSAGPSTPSTLITPGVNRREPKDYARSTAIADDCKKRDKHTCLVTRGGDWIETAHIYPFSLGTKVGSQGYTEFWARLSVLWPAEKVQAWEDAVLGRERTEILPNLISLAPTVHGLWGKAKFALRPIELSADQTTLTVEFHWLQDSAYEPRDLRIRPANPTELDGTTRQTRLFDCRTKRCICSGDILTFTTEDPEKLPLPSVDLLQMQWLLNRLVALAGAADVTDEELDPDDPMGLAPPIAVGDASETGMPEEAEEEEDDEGEEEGLMGTAGTAGAVSRVGKTGPR
ncbi:HNH endonuclease signature motif containing protein [Aspergillus lucknowensis]|uniref:HNH nuclease domain-containing protein n=1 Tax=Aspergillus lucknowensis TaxID=176173 RepID=A0ABR4LPR9_9EURO